MVFPMRSEKTHSGGRRPLPISHGERVEDEGCWHRLDPAAEGTLTTQLAENLRRAMANGVFRAGDRLPGIRQMAKLCGTSVQVPIDAVKTLAEEGLVKPRPRVGCVVLGKSRKLWHGCILMVHVGAHSNYGQNVFCSEVASLLTAANWRVSHFHVPRRKDGYCNLKELARVLAEKSDLVLLPAYDPPVVEVVRKSGIPFMLLATRAGERREPGCIGTTAWTDGLAFADFTAHCREAGVHRILAVRLASPRTPGFLAPRLPDVDVEDMSLTTELNDLWAESLSMLAYEAITARFSARCRARPDLVCFADDYFAFGGLWALERLGLRAPDDVKVVSLSNYGNAPFYPRPLTRFEYNHFAYAAKTVRAILRYLRTGRLPGTVFCDVRYVRGETF